MNQGDRYDLIASQFSKTRDKSLREKKYLDRLITPLQPGASILDLGCGDGKPIASYFIQNGYKVMGVDASRALIQLAQAAFPQMRWQVEDMTQLQLSEKFPAILAWDSFFHLTEADQRIMLEHFPHWLQKKGRILFTTGPEKGSIIDADMLGEKFSYYSLAPEEYESLLEEFKFKILLKEEDQPHHLVWLVELR